jgi:hypothetical protein
MAIVAQYNQLAVKHGGVPVANNVSPRIHSGLSLVGVPDTLIGSDFEFANRLGADEVRSILLGQHLHGRTIGTGFEHGATIATNGNAALFGDWAIYPTAKVEFEDDSVCLVWPDNTKSCGSICRNPGGTSIWENEFVWFLNQRPMTFSKAN